MPVKGSAQGVIAVILARWQTAQLPAAEFHISAVFWHQLWVILSLKADIVLKVK